MDELCFHVFFVRSYLCCVCIGGIRVNEWRDGDEADVGDDDGNDDDEVDVVGVVVFPVAVNHVLSNTR